LASTARSISDTDLTRRIPVSGRDEASLIAEAFNDMLTRLERAFTVQREFLDDTSHELRSPLTVIRGHVEMLEFDLTPEERAESIDLVTDEIERMTQIVHDLALLARAEQPNFLQLGPVDLRELVTTVEHKVTVLAERSWRLQAPEARVVLADRHRLTQALMQLVDNAVKFTQKGMVIGIGAAVEDRVVKLWVDDTGAGVTRDDAERIFARFARGASTEADHRGSGLGLSIVGAIAHAHGGYVRLVPRPGAGARFEIQIPLTPAAADRNPGGTSHR
jgi:signal transduction histidine kinase